MKTRKMLGIAITLLMTISFAQSSFGQDGGAIGRGGVSRSDQGSQRTDVEAYRAEVIKFYQELRTSLKLFAGTSDPDAAKTAELLSSLEADERRISTMSASEIMILRASFVDIRTLQRSNSELRKIRESEANLAVLEKINRAGLWLKARNDGGQPQASKNDPGRIQRAIITDVCPDPSVVPSRSDLAVAEGFVIAEEAIMEALPTDALTVAGHAAAAAVVAATKAGLLAAQTLYDIDTNCVWATFRTTVNTKLDTIINKQDTQLRASIEANLAGLGGVIVLYYTPQANGGYLELSRSIVDSSINNSNATSQPVNAASAYLSVADQYIAMGMYREAYNMLRLAYQQMIF